MGVMLAKAMGNNVTVISTSNSKEALAKKLGADNYVISTNPDSMKEATKTLDLILSTISAPHEMMPYLNLLKLKELWSFWEQLLLHSKQVLLQLISLVFLLKGVIQKPRR